jgi:predicted PurR-regulated permease PerM
VSSRVSLVCPALSHIGLDELQLPFNALESNFITPRILGKWMTLNPVAIFLSFLFWGVPGMLLAVPILSTIKIFCDRVDSLTRFGEFLGV